LIRWSLAHILSQAGYDVTAVEDGLEAFEVASSQHFDCVITDLSMPGLNGWELLDRLAAFKPAPRVIVITGQEETGYRTIVKEKGAFAFVEKSYLIDEIRDALKEALAD
jgi:CheY-like chemotaxis protein